jgi:xylulokinase
MLTIGLDLGTSAIKGVLLDPEGRILAEAIAATELRTPQPGWVEIDPEQHYETVCGVIRQLADSADEEVVGLAMASAAGNTLLTDGEGRPLRPIISWMDSRSRGIDMAPAELAQITGWPCVDSFPLAHLSWLREHEPEVLDAAAHIGMLTDWLIYRLTGQWRLDFSSATAFHLVDQVGRRYHQPLLDRLGIAESKLSPLVDTGTRIGPVTADLGLGPQAQVVAGCFDHPGAARAAGVTEPGQLMLSCGTSWVGFLPHADRDAILDAGLLCDPFLSGDGGPWAGMFSLPQVGRSIDWYIDKVGGKATFNALADGADSAGLTIDLRESPKMPAANFASIARAVMEGAAHLLRERILELKAHGMSFDQAVMVGGASRSPVWPGIVAEITGLEIRVAGRSAGARGAALIAQSYDAVPTASTPLLTDSGQRKCAEDRLCS